MRKSTKYIDTLREKNIILLFIDNSKYNCLLFHSFPRNIDTHTHQLAYTHTHKIGLHFRFVHFE